jgi:hypothetical protein
MKHTPGPWFIAKHGPRFRIIRASVGQEIDRSVKSQYFDLRPDEEQQSNLRLLAAAPKMLAALEKAAEFPAAIYNRVKGLALEKAEKEISKKHGVEKWDSLEDLTSKIAAKGKGVDGEKDVQIEKLKQALKESEDLAATKVKEVEEKYTNDFATRDFNAAINSLPLDGEESAIENQKKLFSSAFKSQYKLTYKEGKTIVLDAENRVVTDKVGDPLNVSDVYKSFAVSHGAKIKEVDAGGRGDASSQQQSTILKGKTFEEVAAAKGVKPMTNEGDALYTEWAAANKN